MTLAPNSPLRSPLMLFLMGLLLAFLTANGVMFYLALDRPGLVVDNYYDRGQDYEKNMLKRLAMDPGWTMKVDAPKFVDVGKPASFAFLIHEPDGSPVEVDSVTFRAYRPADAKQDFEVPMQLEAPGRYQADITFPLLGVWDVLIGVAKGEDEFNTSYRLSAGVK